MPINKISSLHEKLKFKLFADAKHRFWLQQYLENNEMIKIFSFLPSMLQHCTATMSKGITMLKTKLRQSTSKINAQ